MIVKFSVLAQIKICYYKIILTQKPSESEGHKTPKPTSLYRWLLKKFKAETKDEVGSRMEIFIT